MQPTVQEQPPVRAQQPVQTIRGTVQDAISREPLYGANIILAELNKGTITDTDGRFILENVPVGRYSLHIRFVGYEPILLPELLVSSGKEVVLDIAMQTAISGLEEVVVRPSARKDRPINSMANVSARTFSVEEAGRYAGALDDPGRMAGNFAGVTSPGVHVNAIVVRGNAPKGMQWRLEGVDIPVPSHFSGSNVAGGGGLTMFSSSMLANSDFYTGAFPAEYGNATAGVFDMKLRNGNNRKREYAFQVGVQGVEAALEGPLGGRAGGSYLLNYRYSTMALVFPLLPELKFSDEVPVYQDLSFKVNLPAGGAGNFSIWGIGGLSHTDMKGTDEVEEWIYPSSRVRMNFHYNTGTAGITHTKG
ncbi:MAG: carboxypeptidase-like regulatory domain-containing protein, partial [Bacteroidales bacterium]|nr:carboxypeptidase-like regulatory domain-containing protein [Bacteroidales bacterium]